MDMKEPAKLDTAYKKAFNVANKDQRKLLMLSHHLTDQIRAAERDRNKDLLCRLAVKQMNTLKLLAETYGGDDES